MRSAVGGPLGRLSGAYVGVVYPVAAAGLVVLALAFAVLVTGLFEGAYNHAVKNALFLAGAPRSLLLRMFPSPTYELPNARCSAA